jgi:hypothetical protein
LTVTTRDLTGFEVREAELIVNATEQKAVDDVPKDWEAYRSALIWYLSARLRDLRRAEERYGDNGLRRMRAAYDTPADRDGSFQIQHHVIARSLDISNEKRAAFQRPSGRR